MSDDGLERWHYLGGQRHEGYRSDCAVCVPRTPEDRQSPPEEALCGEEEDLAAGNVPPAEEAVPEQLRMWSAHVRGVARSRQKAYAEALSLAQMQFAAWCAAFPVAYGEAMVKSGGPPMNDREAQLLAWFSAGYEAFLREVHAIARNGG